VVVAAARQEVATTSSEVKSVKVVAVIQPAEAETGNIAGVSTGGAIVAIRRNGMALALATRKFTGATATMALAGSAE
jgi:hypothetical protein